MSKAKSVGGAQDPGAIVPALATFKTAAIHLGASTAAALKRRFEREYYPASFLVQLTPTRKGVDLHGLLSWLRSRHVEAPAQFAEEK